MRLKRLPSWTFFVDSKLFPSAFHPPHKPAFCTLLAHSFPEISAPGCKLLSAVLKGDSPTLTSALPFHHPFLGLLALEAFVFLFP